jgi:hypothetical protein
LSHLSSLSRAYLSLYLVLSRACLPLYLVKISFDQVGLQPGISLTGAVWLGIRQSTILLMTFFMDIRLFSWYLILFGSKPPRYHPVTAPLLCIVFIMNVIPQHEPFFSEVSRPVTTPLLPRYSVFITNVIPQHELLPAHPLHGVHNERHPVKQLVKLFSGYLILFGSKPSRYHPVTAPLLCIVFILFGSKPPRYHPVTAPLLCMCSM